jgi:hypothetical protein
MNTGCCFLCWHSHNVVHRFFFFFFLLPSFLLARLFFPPSRDFFNFFCHQEFCLFTSIPRTLRVCSAAAEVQTCSFRCSRDLDGQRASERRGRSVVVGRVETWASAKVRSRPGMQPGEQESAKCGGESRPGCNEPNKCENLLETWMQRAKQVRKSARDLDAKSKRVRKSARDLYVETWMESSVKVRFGASRLRMPRKPNTALGARDKTSF